MDLDARQRHRSLLPSPEHPRNPVSRTGRHYLARRPPAGRVHAHVPDLHGLHGSQRSPRLRQEGRRRPRAGLAGKSPRTLRRPGLRLPRQDCRAVLQPHPGRTGEREPVSQTRAHDRSRNPPDRKGASALPRRPVQGRHDHRKERYAPVSVRHAGPPHHRLRKGQQQLQRQQPYRPGRKIRLCPARDRRPDVAPHHG